jgi:hypothetical protein
MAVRSTSAIVLAALLVCGGEVPQADRNEQRARCSTQAGFDPAASDDALAKLREEGCRTRLGFTSCEPWWEYTVTACVFNAESGRRVEVYSALFVETDTHREHRERMCDAVRKRVTKTDLAYVYNSRGAKMTTCGN